MKFPKQLSTIFLILFLLAFGIGYFILGSLLNPAAAVFAIVAAIFYRLANSTNSCARDSLPGLGRLFYLIFFGLAVQVSYLFL